MPTSIDSLQIEINANATKANDAIDRLCGNIDKLSNSFSRLNTSNLTGLANGVQKLGTAMQGMNNVKTADFTRLANNITKLGNINVSALNSAASSMSHLTRAFNQLGTVSQNAQAVGEMAKNLSKLGGANVQRAITNIPQLATAMNGLMTTLSRSPRVSQNVIQMTNALANLASQGRNIGSATNTLTSGLNRTNRSMQSTAKSSWSLAAAFGKFYASYFLVIRGIKKLWSSIEGTADYIEAFNYFNVAFGKISSEWNKDWEKFGYENAEAYANSFTERMSESLGKLSGIQIDLNKGLLSDTGMKNLGLNIQEITQYASQLASVTNSVGQTGEVSLVASNVFTKLGADISSLFNQDYSGAMKNLQSGLIGQSRALYKYGIDITNATLQTYAYGLGIEKAVSEMTQAEKMQLRMIAILDQSKVAWGDLANTINSPSNMIRQFTNNLKETGMVLGQLFIPLLEKVLPIINGVTIAIKRLLVNIAGFLGIKIDFSSFGQGYSEDIDGVTDSFDDATAAVKKFKTTTLGIDELNINDPQQNSGSGSGAGGGIDLTKEIMDAAAEYEKVWDEAFAKMESKAQAFADAFEKFLQPISDMFKNLFSGNFEMAGGNLSDFFMQLMDIDWDSIYAKASGFGKGLAEFLNGLISPKLFGEVGETIASALNTAIYAVLSFSEEFDWENFGISLGESVNSFFATFDFDALADGLNKFVDGLEESIASFLKTVTWGDIMAKVTGFLGDLELDTIGAIIGTILIKKIGAIKIASAVSKAIGTGITNAITSLGGITIPTLPLTISNFAICLTAFTWAYSPNIAYLWAMFEDQFLRGTIFDTNTWKGIPAKVDKAICDAIDSVGDFLVSAMKETCAVLFNWNETQSLFAQAKESFSKGGVYILEGVLEGFAGAIAFVLEPITDFFVAVYNAICNVFGIHSPAKNMKPLGEFILLGIVDGFTSMTNSFTEAIQAFWNESVAPWFTVEKWLELGENIKTALLTKWSEIKEWWNTSALVLWWTEDVMPWFTAEKWSELWENVKESFATKWGEIKSWWSTTAIAKWWKEDVQPWFTKKKWVDAMIGVKEAFENTWNNAISAIKQIWNTFATWLNEKLTWTIEPVVVLGKTIFPGTTINLGRIPTFQTGGFPEDGLFMANHNELVGQFSNGRTAVANNEQIIEGIKRGVAEANSEEILLLRQQNELLMQLLEKDMSVNIGDREIARANQRGQRSLGYKLIV